MSNELVLAQVNLSMSVLISHLVSTSYYSSTHARDDYEEEDPDLRMVRIRSVSNLSHFQQIQQRKLQLEAASNKPTVYASKGGESDSQSHQKIKYV